jgi:hypothetical protein
VFVPVQQASRPLYYASDVCLAHTIGAWVPRPNTQPPQEPSPRDQTYGNMLREYSGNYGPYPAKSTEPRGLMVLGTRAQCRQRCRNIPGNKCGVVLQVLPSAPVYLLYEYKSTHTDARAAPRLRNAVTLPPRLHPAHLLALLVHKYTY